MTSPTGRALTRREMLVAGFGGVAGAAVALLASPQEAFGADGAPVLVGRSNSGSHATTLTAPGDPALKCVSPGHDGLWGRTKAAGRSGVYGWTGEAGGIGVTGRNTARGVTGELGGKAAVRGQASGDRLALDVVGRARFSRSGFITVPAGRESAESQLGPGIAGPDTRVLATLQTPVMNPISPGQAETRVIGASVDASGMLRVFLYVKASADVRIAWLLLD